jgi:hypothetical protein
MTKHDELIVAILSSLLFIAVVAFLLMLVYVVVKVT